MSRDLVTTDFCSYGFEWPVVVAVCRLVDEYSKMLATFSSTRAITTLIMAEVTEGNLDARNHNLDYFDLDLE